LNILKSNSYTKQLWDAALTRTNATYPDEHFAVVIDVELRVLDVGQIFASNGYLDASGRNALGVFGLLEKEKS